VGLSATPEPITTKLGVRNYVGDPTLTSKYGSNRAAWGSRHMHEISLLVTFFSFFFVSSPRLQVARLTDFHDLYIKRRVFVQGSAFWGSR